MAVLHVVTAPAPGDGPIRIVKDALAPGLPQQDIVVAAGQRIALGDARARHLYGSDIVLAEARDLVHLDGVERLAPRRREIVHVVLDGHGLVPSGALWLEGFPATAERLADLPVHAIDDLFAAMPRLRYHGGLAAFGPDVPVLNRREVHELTSADPRDFESRDAVAAPASAVAEATCHSDEEPGFPAGLRAMIVGG